MNSLMRSQTLTKNPSPVLKVSGFLTEENIVVIPSRLPKEEVFRRLIETLRLPDPAFALKEVLYRELWGRTVIGPGLAIPHARIPGIPHVFAAIGLCPKGILDPNAGPAASAPQVFVLFLGPTANIKLHLEFLASISTLFQTEGLANNLMQLKTPESVFAKIQELEESF